MKTKGPRPTGSDTLGAALSTAHKHETDTGHSTRITLEPRIENRSSSTKWATHGGRGEFTTECRQGCKPWTPAQVSENINADAATERRYVDPNDHS